MQDGFDIWKNRLEEADAGALNEGFDKEAVWYGIQPRVQQRKQNKVWAYAAAMLCGLLLGGTAVRLWMGTNEKHTIAKEIIIKQVVAPINSLQAISVSGIPAVNKQAPASIVNIKKVNTPVKKTVEPSLPQQPQTIPTEEIAVAKEVPQSTAHQSAPIYKPIRVVHLLNIQNEDKKDIVQTSTNTVRPTVVRAIVNMYLPNEVNSDLPGSALQGIVR